MASKGNWQSLNWKDPFLLDQQLNDDQRMVRDTAHQYAQGKLLPRVREAFRNEETDTSIFKEMGNLGLLGSTIQGYDCPGVDYMSYGLVAREIEKIDSGYRSMMSVQSSLVMYPIYAFGSEAQREKYLPRLASGEWIGCFGLTEPDYGSDAGGLISRAKSVKGGYSLSGAKMWISNSPIADVFVVWAKNDEGIIKGFILEKGMEGLSAPKIEGKLALRASVTGQIASGCNIIAFTTGRGSAFGSKPSPCIKIASNSNLYNKMPEDMDIDAGKILSENSTVGDIGEQIYKHIINVASGDESKSETQGLGDYEFVPWQIGAVM